MSRSLLISSIISAVGKNHPNLVVTQAAADTIVKSVTETIHASLKTNGHFSLQGFGTFRVAARAARKGTNPLTKAKIDIPASQTVAFKASPQLKAQAQDYPAFQGRKNLTKVEVPVVAKKATTPKKAAVPKKTVTKTAAKTTKKAAK